ncbi:GVQW3 [Trypoxylus dichotomus]
MSKTRVYDWAKRFKQWCESVDDDPHEGPTVTSYTSANVDHLHVLITSDWCLSILPLFDELNINKGTIRSMLHENLNMRKTCVKMVPRLLTREQKHMRKSICEDLLSRVQSDGRD